MPDRDLVASPVAPHVSLVILAGGDAVDVQRCLAAARDAARGVVLETFVVGAAPQSGVPGAVAIPADGGRALGAAANRAVAAARAPFVAFLHGDSIPRAGWLDALLDVLAASPAAAVSSRLITPAGEIEADGYDFAYAAPYPITPRPVHAGAVASPGGRPFEVSAALAAALLVRRDAFLAVNGFDDALDFPAAELDLCLRLGERFGPVYCAPGSAVVHHARCAGDIGRDDAARFTTRWLEPLSRARFDRVPRLAPASRPPAGPRPAAAIVIPTLDAIETVAPCVETALAGMGPLDELILADGGSSDGTLAFLDVVAAREGERVRVIRGEAGHEAAAIAGITGADRAVVLVVPPIAELPETLVDEAARQIVQGGCPVSVVLGRAIVFGGRADLLRRMARVDAGALLASDASRLAQLVKLSTFSQASYAGQSAGAGRASLVGRFCTKPWDWFEVSADGTIRMCCPAWLPTPIGNVLDGDVAGAWNSLAARAIRESILDGSFRFCVQGDCPYIQGGTLPERSGLTDERVLAAIEGGTLAAGLPTHFNMSYDASCNLACPSCRTRKQIVSSDPRTERIHRALDAWLFGHPRSDAFTLHMSGAGDPFASRGFRGWLHGLDGKDFPGLTIDMQTNGVMFTPKMWEKMHRLHGHLGKVWVSFDAATPETYAWTRRGGHWRQLLDNMRFLDGLRRDGLMQLLRVDFVVQQRNYREMPALVELIRQYPHVDGVSFMLIRDLGTYSGKFGRHAIWMESHPEHREFLEVLRSPVLADPRVVLGNVTSFRQLALSAA